MGARIQFKSGGRLVLTNASNTETEYSATDLMTGLTKLLAITSSAAEVNYTDVTTIGTVQASKAAVVDANLDISGFRNVGLTGTLAFSTNQDIKGAQTSGATLTSLLITPKASATTTSINYHKLVAIGDITGNTAFGMGDPAKPTTGLMACFGRTALATGSMTDTAADIRIINKLVDNTGVHNLQGLYVKVKNYSSATTTGSLIGAFIEVVNNGTVSGSLIGLKLGKDDTSADLTADIMFSNGIYFVAMTSAVTATSTDTTAPAGSLGVTTHNTGAGKLFMSDGSKWQYAGVA